MKTNQIMKRPMGEFVVEQRTKDAMFNATTLLKQWNTQDGVSQRKLDNYFNSPKTQEFVKTIMERENLNTPKMVYLKTKGKYGGTWMHPLMFIDFAMWINPVFKYDVLKFVSDQMLYYRNESGDAYRKLSSAVSRIVLDNKMRKLMPNIGKALNWIVFNKHEIQVRNEFGLKAKQRELFDVERQVAMLINDGFIPNYDYLIAYLRKKYVERWMPKEFK